MRTILDLGVRGVTVLMMGAVGMELEGRHLRAVMRRKGLLLLALAAQAVVLPALGFGLTRAMALPPDLSAGILLLAACPVGDIANVYTLLNRIEYAVFAVVYFLTEVPLLLGVVAASPCSPTPAMPQADLSRNPL